MGHTTIPRVLALACALATGCTLVNAPSDHTGGEIELDQFCPIYADIVCRAHLDCCPTPMVSYDDCLSAVAGDCQEGLVPLATDPRTGYSPDAAARVVAQGSALAASCDLGIVDFFVRRDGLQGALAGTVEPGGACMDATGFEAPAMWSCTDLTQSCRPGAPSWRCAPRSPAGEACFIDFDCQEGTYCDALVIGIMGTCRPQGATAATCTKDTQCQSLICEGGSCLARDVTNTYCNFRPGSMMTM